jgi:hypothetical protein
MSARVRLLFTDAAGVAPYVGGLRALERDIVYPIADGADHFRIDHGPAYTPFFTDLGEPYFMLALEGDSVVGNAVGILRHAIAGERRIVAGYGCDWKLAHRHRGTGLGARLVAWSLAQLLRPSQPRLRSWRFAYGAMMRGKKGDILDASRGLHPLRVGRPYAQLLLYFVPPPALARLPDADAPAPPSSPGLDLSPDTAARATPPGIVSTAGKKDLRLVSTGKPWPLEHLVLGPRAWRPTLAAYLRDAGQALVSHGAPGPACFALDERLGDHVAWLAAQGLAPGASCRIAAMRLIRLDHAFGWVHLATSEI